MDSENTMAAGRLTCTCMYIGNSRNDDLFKRETGDRLVQVCRNT